MTYLNDITSNALILQSAHPGAGTVAGTTGFTAGTTCDFLLTQGQCTIVQSIGQMTGNTPRVQTKVQESTDGTTWTDVTGASFAVTATSLTSRSLSFSRTKRYLRSYYTMDGTGTLSILVSDLIIAQKQQV